MSLEYVVIGLISVALLAYLFFCLLKPERL
ncbi:MAG: K(+)-transporting ATPase subunit F [Armatimonadota bacterium]